MSPRALLVGLIVAATAAFIVGTTIERNSGHTEKKSAAKAEAPSAEGSSHKEGGGETPGAHSESASSPASNETHQELKPLGIDIEAAPFVALAAVASLLLALGAGCGRAGCCSWSSSPPRCWSSPRSTCARSFTKATRTGPAWPYSPASLRSCTWGRQQWPGQWAAKPGAHRPNQRRRLAD